MIASEKIEGYYEKIRDIEQWKSLGYNVKVVSNTYTIVHYDADKYTFLHWLEDDIVNLIIQGLSVEDAIAAVLTGVVL